MALKMDIFHTILDLEYKKKKNLELNMKELSILKIYKNGLLNRLNNKILKLYLSLMDKKLSINSVPNLMELVSFLSYQKLLLLAMNSKEKIISQ
jgi:hypothetical protein